jgi:putative tryptophan/tyrosine transport system substrate-binding protein
LARAQEAGKTARIGVLMGIAQNDPDAQPRVAAFQNQLQELGWTDGRNIRIDYRWLTPDADRVQVDAAQLVASAPDLIVADTTAALTALRDVSGNIPIVFLRISDPVGAGFIESLARPEWDHDGCHQFRICNGRQVA